MKLRKIQPAMKKSPIRRICRFRLISRSAARPEGRERFSSVHSVSRRAVAGPATAGPVVISGDGLERLVEDWEVALCGGRSVVPLRARSKQKTRTQTAVAVKNFIDMRPLGGKSWVATACRAPAFHKGLRVIQGVVQALCHNGSLRGKGEGTRHTA